MSVQIYSGGSVGGAAMMNEEKTDICLNWAGAYSGHCCLSICHARLALIRIEEYLGNQDLSCGEVCSWDPGMLQQ